MTGWGQVGQFVFSQGTSPQDALEIETSVLIQLPWPLKNLFQDLGHLLFFACISQFFPPYAVTTSPLTVCSFWPASLSSERQQTLWILFPLVCVFPLNFSLLYFCLSKRMILTFFLKLKPPTMPATFSFSKASLHQLFCLLDISKLLRWLLPLILQTSCWNIYYP